MICIESDTISLLKLEALHEEAFLTAVEKSSTLYQEYVSPPQNHEAFLQQLKKNDFERNYSLLSWHKEDKQPIGVINFNEVIRGLFQNAFLGFYGFKPYEGKDLMRQSLQLAMIYAKDALHLHRLEANIQPSNYRSINLVKRLGFVKEGYSKDYLKINGQWRDHERWASLLSSE